MAKPAPARSIAFAAVSPAEEQGLLAPNISASICPFPLEKITLDLNYDALAPIGEPKKSKSAAPNAPRSIPQSKLCEIARPGDSPRCASRSRPLLPL